MIFLDIRRTYPENVSFTDDGYLSPLSNVLTAFACYNTKVGYCQVCLEFQIWSVLKAPDNSYKKVHFLGMLVLFTIYWTFFPFRVWIISRVCCSWLQRTKKTRFGFWFNSSKTLFQVKLFLGIFRRRKTVIL